MTAGYGLERCKHGMQMATCGYCSPKRSTVVGSRRLFTAPRNELGKDLLISYVPALRARLIEAARSRRVIFYGEIMNDFGGRGHIGKVLDEVNREQHASGEPLLAALAVLKDTGRPSEGFWTLIEEFWPGQARSGFWEAECERIWAYKW